MVTEGQKFEVERQNGLNIDVLLFSDGSKIEVGNPVLDKVEVKAKILEDKKDKKISVIRYRAKSRYRKNKGHRQPISVIEIESIGYKGDKTSSKTADKAETKAESKVEAKTSASASKTENAKKPVAKKASVKTASTKAKKVTKKEEKK